MTPAEPFIVVGSFNAAKAAEMATLLGDFHVAVRSLRDFPAVRPVPETGTTFGENARLKALGMAAQIHAPDFLGLVADDSGLEVDALGGRPGVYSARYVSESATDPQRVQRILEELGDLPYEKRTARFRCHVAFAAGGRILIETDGAVEGIISFAPSGDFGFGYDPIFVPLGHDRSFGELGAKVKHRISHRAKALRAFHDRFGGFLTAQARPATSS